MPFEYETDETLSEDKKLLIWFLGQMNEVMWEYFERRWNDPIHVYLGCDSEIEKANKIIDLDNQYWNGRHIPDGE